MMLFFNKKLHKKSITGFFQTTKTQVKVHNKGTFWITKQTKKSLVFTFTYKNIYY